MTGTDTLTPLPESSKWADSTVPDTRCVFHALPKVRLASDADIVKCAFACKRAPTRRLASVVGDIATARDGEWRRGGRVSRTTQHDLAEAALSQPISRSAEYISDITEPPI
jgi:hypothetical protein